MCAFKTAVSRKKGGNLEEEERSGEVLFASDRNETRQKLGRGSLRLGKGEGRGVTETRFTDRPSVPSVKRNSILRNGGFQGLNVYGEEGLTSLSIEFRTRGEKDLK